MKLFLSCEHGGNNIPGKYLHLFPDARELLETHRGYDNGALELFHALANLGIHFSIFSKTSRLLVDLNRSLHRRSLFSEYSSVLSAAEKTEVLNCFYHPYRNTFFTEIARITGSGEGVFHVSVHAFTPVLNGVTRDADIGLLYDPSRVMEKKLASTWKNELQKVFPRFVIRYNYPYLGKTDGHVAPLRQAFGNKYAGIEFELNSKHAGNIEVINGIVLTYNEITKYELFLGALEEIQ